MKIHRLVNGETGEYRFVNSYQIDRGEFTTELFCGDRIDDIQPSCLADAKAENARTRLVETTLSAIAEYERKSGNDKYPCIGSQAEADRGEAWSLTVALGLAIEKFPADFWITNRAQHYDLEDVFRNMFGSDGPTFFGPKRVR